MHVVMSTVGTEGDVRPFLAVALGLVGRGHRVTIATHTDYEEMISARGVGFRPIGGSFRRLVESESGRAWIESSDSLLEYLRRTRELFEPLGRRWTEDAYEAASDADAVLAHPFSVGATFAAEKNGRPAAVLALPPFVESGEVVPPFFLGAPRWSWLRRALGRLSVRGIGGILLPHLNRVRARAGLRAIPSPVFTDFLLARGVPLLHLFSPSLVPRPSDWPRLADVTGFCFLEDASKPAPDLVRFVEAGPPPLYVGFGSMTGRDPRSLAELTVRALRGRRAVVVTGWSGAAARGRGEDENVFLTEHASHEWLLPRVHAVVHHGGAGTTAAGLRAGRPTLVVAFFGDQPFWGHCVHRVGSGPRPLLRRNLDESSLATAIDDLERHPSYREAARRMQVKLAAEDGVLDTVARVEALVS